MPWIETIPELIAVAVLIGYLFAKQGQRLREFDNKPFSPEGSGLDAGPLCERVRRVRADYGAQVRSRPQDSHYRLSLLARARRAISGLDFFRENQAENSMK